MKKMDFESCNPAAQFAIQQSQNSFVIPNATPFIEFDLNVLATGHVGLTIRIFDVTQPLSFAVFNRVQPKPLSITIERRFKRRRCKRIVRSDPEELKVQNVEIVSKLNTLMIEKLPI